MFNEEPKIDRREQEEILESMPVASGRNARAIMGIRDYVALDNKYRTRLTKNKTDSNVGYIQAMRDQLADVAEAFLDNGVKLYIPWNEVASVRFTKYQGEYPHKGHMNCSFPYVPMAANLDVRKIEPAEDLSRDRFNELRYGSKTPRVPTDFVLVESEAWPIRGRYEGWGEIFVATTNAIKDLIKKRGTSGLEIVGMRVQPIGVGISVYDQLDLGMIVGNVAVDIAYDGRGFSGEGMDILVPEKEDRLSELERKIKIKAKNG